MQELIGIDALYSKLRFFNSNRMEVLMRLSCGNFDDNSAFMLLLASLLLSFTLLRLLLIELSVVEAIAEYNRTLEGVFLHVAHQS
jgi:hypothetical protein